MSDMPLFISEAFNSLKSSELEVTTKEKTVYNHYIKIDDINFDVKDLYETLDAIDEGDSYLTNPNMIKMMKKYGVIGNEGSSKWMTGATKGPYFKDFVDLIKSTMLSKEVNL